MLFFGSFILYGGYKFWPIIQAEIPLTEGQIESKYYSHIKKGDKFFKSKQYENALVLYDKADELKPDAYKVKIRIAFASTYLCRYFNEKCYRADWITRYLYDENQKDTIVLKLNKILVKAYNENNPNDSESRKPASVFDQYFKRK